ncbi:unnamed protein product [Polarella glacialis]|uniref:Uncharacterized protein n=1 Tax=Polarella glacialis TaxID=89957 RepID=A0A813HXZ4_POLGL|nr:unnamed protein product [Polarella glacialis]
MSETHQAWRRDGASFRALTPRLSADDDFEVNVLFDAATTPTPQPEKTRFVLGITKASAALGSVTVGEDPSLLASFVAANPEGCFLEVLGTAGYPRLCRWHEDGRLETSFVDGFGAVFSGLTARFEDGQLTFSSGHRSLGPLPMNSHGSLPEIGGPVENSYRPCVLLCSLGASVLVNFRRKRFWRPAPASSPRDLSSESPSAVSPSLRPQKERRCSVPKASSTAFLSYTASGSASCFHGLLADPAPCFDQLLAEPVFKVPPFPGS